MIENNYPQITIVIDVFRAFTTACYVLDQNPNQYVYATKSSVLEKFAINCTNVFFIGKNEVGAKVKYDIPNSPTRVKEVNLSNKIVLHRTEAGSKGILNAVNADIILATSFVNISATVKYIKKFKNPEIKIIAMGHEARTPSLEDDLCAKYIQSLLDDEYFDITDFVKELKNNSGKYFFLDDQWQYPKKDFEYCLKIDEFDFAIQATTSSDYAILTKCK